MTPEFHKFPSTPHLAWLGREPVRGDKVMTPAEAREFLGAEIVAEEKVDGANLGISFDPAGQPHFQNRGNYLTGPASGQWKPLRHWSARRLDALREHLRPGLVLFGEWCHATHSIPYNKLPDWFIAFDVFDTGANRFWSTPRRDELAARLGLQVVPRVFHGRAGLPELVRLVSKPSAFAASPREGIYLRGETPDYLTTRAKLVNADFTQSIGEHWTRGGLRSNTLAGEG